MMLAVARQREAEDFAMAPQHVRGAPGRHPGYYRRQRCRRAAHFAHKQTAEAHMQKASFLTDEVREMFDRIDEDGDRSINFDEFAGLMLEMDHAKLNSELRACFDFIDTDHDGRVSFDEFCQWVSR